MRGADDRRRTAAGAHAERRGRLWLPPGPVPAQPRADGATPTQSVQVLRLVNGPAVRYLTDCRGGGVGDRLVTKAPGMVVRGLWIRCLAGWCWCLSVCTAHYSSVEDHPLDRTIGCPRIIRTYDFTRISSLWCNRRSSSFQTFLKYTSRVIDECCIVPRSCRGLVPSPVRLALG